MYLSEGGHGLGSSLNAAEVFGRNADDGDKKKGGDFHDGCIWVFVKLIMFTEFYGLLNFILYRSSFCVKRIGYLLNFVKKHQLNN